MKKTNKVLMRPLKFVALAGAVVVLTISTIQAQPVKYAQAGMPFLRIDVSPRNAAMGGAQIGVVGDAMDMFGNPAGMARVEGLSLASSVTNWIVDTKLYGAGAAYHLGNAGVFGVGLVWMDYGTFTRTVPVLGADIDPTLRNKGYMENGTFSVKEYAAGLSYARQISDRFAVGGQLKYATQNLGDVVIYDEFEGKNVNVSNSVNNIALDFGTVYYTGFKDLRFGMSFRNFSNQSDYFDQRFELPLTFTFGLAMDMFTLLPSLQADGANKLTVAFDWVHPRDYSERQHLGVEYSYHEILFVRGGYRFNYDEQGVTGGLGVNLGLGDYTLRANYAYEYFGKYFDGIHRISLGVTL